jgi:hypothetical protein
VWWHVGDVMVHLPPPCPVLSVAPLQRKHAYKFIVDDEWRFAPDQETIADSEGNINNVIDLTGFADDSEVLLSKTGVCALFMSLTCPLWPVLPRALRV